MKIAQITSTFPPYMAGTGNVCYQYSLELAKLGHEVVVYTSRFPDIDYKYPDLFKVERLKPIFTIGNMYCTPQLLKITDFDILHLHYPCYFGGEMVYLVSKLKGTPYVITYHNDVLYPGLMGRALKLHRLIFMRRILDSASKICVSSEDFARHSFCDYMYKDEANNIIEIPIGVNSDLVNPGVGGEEIRKQYEIKENGIILFVGALDRAHYFKGIEYLLKSFAKVKNDPKLMIVGDGDLKDQYVELSKQLGIKNRTIFTGNVLNEKLPQYYAASDLVVLPSTIIESFGIVLIEAMSCGIPVIASNIPGVRTVVDHDVNGYLVEPRDVDELASKMQYLLDNITIRTRFGESGREKVLHNYDWGIIGKNLEKVYEEVLS